MSDTYKHKRQRLLKTKIARRTEDLAGYTTTTSIPYALWSDAELFNAIEEFYRGATRHGNKRHFESAMKQKRKKSGRYKLKQETRDLLDYFD